MNLMPSKAVTTHALFLVATIVLLLIFTIISFWYWIGQTGLETNRNTCTAKFMNYCGRWVLEKRDPGDWDQIEPKNCEKFEISSPSSMDDCKNIT